MVYNKEIAFLNYIQSTVCINQPCSYYQCSILSFCDSMWSVWNEAHLCEYSIVCVYM